MIIDETQRVSDTRSIIRSEPDAFIGFRHCYTFAAIDLNGYVRSGAAILGWVIGWSEVTWPGIPTSFDVMMIFLSFSSFSTLGFV